MGVDTRKPYLPAPTDSSTLDTTGGSVTGTDLATDISRRTDKTSYSIPDDGSPITITTRRKSTSGDKHDRRGHSHPSQTSLLIEYFEGGKSGPDVRSRPSVRVKVTPSSSKKSKDTHDHVQITETSGNKRPSYSRRISLGKGGVPKGAIEGSDDRSVSPYISAEEDSNLAHRGPPVEIEVLHKDHGSDLSGTSLSRDSRYIQPTSDISSLPASSMLEENVVETTESPKGDRSRIGRDVAAGLAGAAIATIARDHLKTPSRRRSRSPSTERITQKVMEKLSKPRESSSGNRLGEKSRSRSVSKELLEAELKSPRKRSGRHRDEDFTSAESSLLSSNLSPRRRSGDQTSVRSGTSKSSLNNPKLLETVEDAIRRLILPELKELKKDQKVQQNRSKFEHDQSTLSGSSVSRGDITRRISKHSSLPDVHKSRISREDRDYDVGSSGESTRRRRERRRDHGYDSPSERNYDRRTSESTVVDDQKVSRKRSKDGHRVRDAAAGALAGGVLTAAALKHHESKDKERRRKRRSKSRSRSASIAESEEIFEKHDIPPMPMRSDIGSELTRDSLLSERTAEPSTPGRGPEVREVIRGSPREILSPASRTPTRTPQDLQKGLGTLHENVPREDVSVHSVESESEMYHDDEYDHPDHHHSAALKGGLAGAAAGVGVLAAGHLLDRYHGQETYSPGGYVHGRGLSPIQSVASYEEEHIEEPHRESLNRPASNRSLSSPTKYASGQADNLSIGSISSAASTKMARSKRHHGINLEKPSEVLAAHELPRDELSYDESPREANMDQWYDEQHRENDRYRNSSGDESLDDPTVDYKRMTNYTDDSMDAPYLDKVAAAQQILGIGANPEYRHTPIAVESAVASLHDPSVVSIRSTQSPSRSYPASLDRQQTRSVGSLEGSERAFAVSDKGSPLKHRIDAEDIPDKSFHGRMRATSPPQSVTRSLDGEDEPIQMGASGIPVAHDPMPEIGYQRDSYQRDSSHESDLNTNPSIIQGPMAGVPNEDRDHWPYQPTPPRSKGLMSPHSDHSGENSMNPVEAGLLGAAIGGGLGALAVHKMNNHDKGLERNVEGDGYDAGVNHDFAPQREAYMSDQIPTPPGVKDEGYISAAPAKSPSALTPEPRNRDVGMVDNQAYDDDTATEDPFTGATHTRHLSGYSQGMPSPLYDGATGRGIDRIQSKDIVALMDHLTVRDAQRNARDTEILVTLVRSAAEMRNSFEDMRRFIAEQDDFIMDEAERQHESTRKTLGGPRPQPAGMSPKYSQRGVGDAALDAMQAKRKNVFRRALKGLGMKSTNDLGRMEEMLVQLLGEVEGLKAAQLGQPQGIRTKSSSLDSVNNPREVNQDGYEPEGQAGTSSTGNQSGYLSNHSSRPAGDTRAFSGRKGSENRVSTVLEGNEEQDEHDDTVLYGDQISNVEDYEEDRLATPTQELERGGSVPLATPPRVYVPSAAHINENTPRTNTDKSRKHKSSSSSFIPKFISRWSKTTASSAGENTRQSIQRKERPYSEASRSGSDLNYQTYDNYDHHGDDKLRSQYSLEDEAHLQENRPPSPLVPSQVSDHPKYQAHRNSLNLQHPQPRQGPTGRYQSHLESQAQNFGSPISPTSDQWGSNPQLQPVNTNRHSYSSQPGHLSPISDGGYSDTSSTAPPPRPPKIKDEGPLIPQRPLKLREGQSPTTYADHVAAARMGGSQSSPTRSASGQTPQQRKPTGPRPITTSGQYSPDKIAQLQKKRYKGSPNHIESSNEDLTF